MQDKELMYLVLIACSILVLILIGFVGLVIFLHQRKHSIFERQLETIKNNNEKEILRSQLQMQELTFQHISGEIHDNIGQFLSLAKLHLNTLSLNNPQLAQERITDSTGLLTKALDELRDLSKSMSSELICSIGLGKAIEMQLIQLQKAGSYHILFDIKGRCRPIDDQKEIILFRILQEALNNIVKHSAAQEVIVLLSYLPTSIKLFIKDNGLGFDTSGLSDNGSVAISGVRNMKKRAKMIDGELEILGVKGKGTTISVSVPY